MFCPKCGAPIKDGHKFCTACGFSVEGIKTAPAPSREERPAGAQQPGKRPPAAVPGKRPAGAQQPGKRPAAAAPEKRPVTAVPGKRPARKKKKGMSLGLLIGLIAAGVLLIAGLVTLFLLHPWRSDDDLRDDDRKSDVSGRWDDEDDEDEKDDKRAETKPAATEAPKPAVREYSITVWTADRIVELTRRQIDDFNRTNEYGVRFNATVEACGVGDAATRMICDVESGADIYCFASDQLARLVYVGALSPVGGAAADGIRAANDGSSVIAATEGGVLYAYPMTADNGYFMYYDKAVIPEEDVDSLEKIIQACELTNRKFAFDVTGSAWYTASWFFATGCVSEWTTDGDGQFIGVTDTFNSPQGLVAARGMKKLLGSRCYLASSSTAEFGDGAAVVVSGTWDYEQARAILGDRLGITDLPSFTVDGQSYHLGSFSGSKFMGVKPHTDRDRTQALHWLAEYLTGEVCQTERAAQIDWGPSNLNAQQSPAVQANPAVAAVLKQNQYARPQGQIPGNWWQMGMELAADILAARNEGEVQKALNKYSNNIAAMFGMSEAEKNAWGVIGAICDTFWDTDFLMTETEPGVWRSGLLTLHKGEEFKVRQGKDWSVNYGRNGRDGENCVVDRDGDYYVWFDSATGKIWLERK